MFRESPPPPRPDTPRTHPAAAPAQAAEATSYGSGDGTDSSLLDDGADGEYGIEGGEGVRIVYVANPTIAECSGVGCARERPREAPIVFDSSADRSLARRTGYDRPAALEAGHALSATVDNLVSGDSGGSRRPLRARRTRRPWRSWLSRRSRSAGRPRLTLKSLRARITL